MREMWRPRRVMVAFGGGLVLAAVITGQVLDLGQPVGGPVAPTAAIAVSFTVLGGWVLAALPGHLVGRLMLAAGGSACLAAVAVSWTGWLPLAWLSQWTWWPSLGLIVLSLLVFPDGALPSARWRPVAVLIIAATAVATIGLAVAALDAPQTLLTSAEPPPTDRALLLVRVAVLAIAVVFLGCGLVLASLWLRWRRATGQTRQQLGCLLAAGILLLIGLVLDALGISGAWLVAVVAVPVAMMVAVLRYRLYRLDLLVNRTIVWLVMTLLVIAGFVALVAVLRQLVTGGQGANASLLATGLIAVLFEPLRRRVQRGVDRLLYGDRDDPYQVIARTGELLGRTAEPAAVLPLLAATIARSLQVPYVALELDEPAGPRRLVEHGEATASVETFDLPMHAGTIGRLVVATRGVGSRFSRWERRLLSDVAVQAAVAVAATRLVRELQDSREQLVLAREEERRRLRRELHDGLGPALAGMSMQVRAVHKLVSGQQRAEQLLGALAQDLRACTAEVRQLVDQLRPPALDGGLAAALRAQCRRFDPATLPVSLTIEGELTGLPAAVEVAAYRIVAEALTNVARHAGASHVTVTVDRGRELTVTVTDDGPGIDPAAKPGVGLTSMRERATELGGECEVSAAAPRGTRVRVRLPLGVASAAGSVA